MQVLFPPSFPYPPQEALLTSSLTPAILSAASPGAPVVGPQAGCPYQRGPVLTPPGPGAPRRLAACTAWGIAARLAQGPAEVLVHHRADVPLEIGEQDAAGVDVLSLWRALFLWTAFFLFYTGRCLAGKRAAAATAVTGAGVTLLGFLHFWVIGYFLLKERKRSQFQKR